MRRPNIFYGYWIVAVAFLCSFITSGTVGYTFPLFFKPLEAEFGWSRGAISIALTINLVTHAAAAPLIGRLVDRYGTRRVVCLGALIGGLGFVWLSYMQDLWSFYLAYIVIGAGMTSLGPIATTKVVSNWFTRRRGLVVGIALTGIGIGGFVFAPLVGAYLIPGFGWRTAYLVLAPITWVLIIPLALLVIKERPADLGLHPDGLAAAPITGQASPSAKTAERWTLGMAAKTSTLWLILMGGFAIFVGGFGAVQHQVNHVTDVGFPVAIAAAALGAVGLCSAIGKLIFGGLCDLIGAKYVAAMGGALKMSAIIVLMTLKADSPSAMIWLYAILMGLGMGGSVPAMPMLVSSNFGLASYGTIYGTVSLVNGLALGLGPLAAGQMFDAMHTYYWAFLVFVALFVLGIPLMLAVRRPKFPLASAQQPDVAMS